MPRCGGHDGVVPPDMLDNRSEMYSVEQLALTTRLHTHNTAVGDSSIFSFSVFFSAKNDFNNNHNNKILIAPYSRNFRVSAKHSAVRGIGCNNKNDANRTA